MVLTIMCQTYASVALSTTSSGHFQKLIFATLAAFHLGAGNLVYNFVNIASMAMSNASGVPKSLVLEAFAFAGG